ncbi:MAG: helix-hairpin-helix domain-containing protein [Thermoleophilaceae bacterium]|nr:helix-hairpin-helix domain-containing protein [Thermoleophilaceae bacterium]
MDEIAKWRMVAGFVALALLALVAVRGLGSDAGERTAAPVRIAGGPKPGGRARPPTRSAGIYVHVAGAVRRPGLLRIPKGARIALAVHRAGGPTPEAEMAAVNLAQRLSDGQQVIVPRAGAGPVAGAPGSTGVAGAEDVPVSLASATSEQLEELDGIGPALAERILEFRDESGGFRSVGQLQEVEGIGEKRYAALKEAVVP